MLTLEHKNTLLQLLINNRFNLTPQEMGVVVQAITALAQEIDQSSRKEPAVPND